LYWKDVLGRINFIFIFHNEVLFSSFKLQHGRRTPSMKASLMAMSDLAKELTIPKDVYSSAPSTPTASHEPKISRTKK
jgi:hypothetical protein